MPEWLIYFRSKKHKDLYFRVIMAEDIDEAFVIGQDMAPREEVVLVGVAPYADTRVIE